MDDTELQDMLDELFAAAEYTDATAWHNQHIINALYLAPDDWTIHEFRQAVLNAQGPPADEPQRHRIRHIPRDT